MIKSLKKLIDDEMWVLVELVIIGLAALMFYITKKFNPVTWHIIILPLIVLITFIVVLALIPIYKLINLFKKKSRK